MAAIRQLTPRRMSLSMSLLESASMTGVSTDRDLAIPGGTRSTNPRKRVESLADHVRDGTRRVGTLHLAPPELVFCPNVRSSADTMSTESKSHPGQLLGERFRKNRLQPVPLKEVNDRRKLSSVLEQDTNPQRTLQSGCIPRVCLNAVSARRRAGLLSSAIAAGPGTEHSSPPEPPAPHRAPPTPPDRCGGW
ncbi:hypothetical protein ACVWZX_004502 [Deinococcus sp. UYEF24]